MDCWAAVTDNCSGRISKEHLISKAVYEADSKYIPLKLKCFGLSSSNGDPIEIPYQSLQSKILCERHNNDLSILDAEAGKFAKIILEIDNLEVHKPSFENQASYQVSGILLERWFMKTAINLTYSQHGIRPTEEMVEIAFGKRSFSKFTGLSIFKFVNEPMQIKTHDFKTELIGSTDGGMSLVTFEFFGISFLLPVVDEDMQKVLNFNVSDDPKKHLAFNNFLKQHSQSLVGADIEVHPPSLSITSKENSNCRILLKW